MIAEVAISEEPQEPAKGGEGHLRAGREGGEHHRRDDREPHQRGCAAGTGHGHGGGGAGVRGVDHRRVHRLPEHGARAGAAGGGGAGQDNKGLDL